MGDYFEGVSPMARQANLIIARKDAELAAKDARIADQKKWISDLEREYGTTTAALRKQLAEFGAGEDTTTMTRKSFAEVLQALADVQKELADMKRADWKVAHIKDLEGQLTERRDRVDDLDKELSALREWLDKEINAHVPPGMRQNWDDGYIYALRKARAALNPSPAGREG